jgi:thioredoxin reductase (NADPH)
VGAPWSSESHAVRDLLARNGISFGDYDAASAEGRALLEETGADPGRLPVLAMSDGQVLVQPSVGALAQALGVATRPDSGGYDVVVIGAGPAGLAAAVYAASEGLRTLVLEREALGGQAGTSSLIRNYLGFPMGLSGTEFAVRAFQQAMLFGVDFVFANGATAIGVNGGLAVRLVEGDDVPTRVVVLATGVSYRRLGIPALEHRIGAGVYYGAAVSEAEALAGLDVAIVGGGNSAGQAAMHLAQRARRVHLLVRGPSLAASMSDYLVRGLARASNVELHLHAEVVDGSGAGSLDALTVRDVRTGVERSIAARALFVLIGAEPTTGWLPPEIARDGWGYVLTGAEVDAGAERVGKAARPFETSLAGVFAVGDVRHGSTKRVASAVGEGSACISFVHERLANPG